jgi:hypothetical protein
MSLDMHYGYVANAGHRLAHDRNGVAQRSITDCNVLLNAGGGG